MIDASRETFEIEADALSVLAWVDTPIPFDGLTDGARALRRALRGELARLSAQPGEALHATFTGVLRRGSDLENVLFYNVDPGASVFGPSTAYGLSSSSAAAGCLRLVPVASGGAVTSTGWLPWDGL